MKTSEEPGFPKQWLSTKEAATRLNLKPDTLNQWRYRGFGPVYYRMGDGPGARCRYRSDDLDRWIAGRRRSRKPKALKLSTDPYIVSPPPKTGWICPKCGAGVAPWMPYCSLCRREEKPDGK